MILWEVKISIITSLIILHKCLLTSATFSRYVGCYEDKGDTKELPMPAYTSDSGLTQEKCWQKCKELGYVYAGLQGGFECWCGQDYGRNQKLSDTDCYSNCAGDPSKKCGGPNRNQIFMVQAQPCLGGWKHVQETKSCYKALYYLASWTNANQKCKDLDASMVTVASEREQYFLNMMMFYNYADHWMGATYQHGINAYMWSDNAAFRYNNWLPLQPGLAGCVYMTKDIFADGAFPNSFQWGPENCTSEKHVVCEMAAAQCDPLPTVYNLMVSSTDLGVGTVLQAKCITGHEFPDGTTNKTLTCDPSGSNSVWSATLTSCSLMQCPNITTVRNAVANSTVQTYGTTVGYTCMKGFVFPDGSLTKYATCQSDKTWSSVPAECERVVCPPISYGNNSVTVGNGTRFEDTYNVTCDHAYMFPDYTVTKQIGCTAEAKWNDTIVSCQPLECPDFYMENVEPDKDDRIFESVVTVWCERGYKFPDNLTSITVECTSDAAWNDTVPDCDPITCIPFPPNVMTRSNGTGTGFGTEVIVDCPEGKEFLDGNTTMKVRCESLGYWVPTVLSCAPKLNIKALKSLPPQEAPEAAAVGTPAIVLLVLFVVIIIFLDLTTLQRDIDKLKKNLQFIYKTGQEKVEEELLQQRRERFKQIYGFYHPHM